MLKVEEIEPSAKCAERRVEFYLSTYLYRSEKLSYGAYVSKHACLPFIRTVEFREFTQADCSAQPLVELDFINLYRSMRSNPDAVRIKKKKKLRGREEDVDVVSFSRRRKSNKITYRTGTCHVLLQQYSHLLALILYSAKWNQALRSDVPAFQ